MALIAPNKPKRLKLLNIPEDVWCILIQEQAKIKKEKKRAMFGLEQTVYAIIREQKRCEQL